MAIRTLFVSICLIWLMGCHTTSINNPPVPPISEAPRPAPGPFDYPEKGDSSVRALKKRLAVARFEDNIPVKDSPFGEKRETDIVGKNIHVHREDIAPEKHYVPSQFTEKLIDSLAKTNRFILVERKDINSLLREVSFTESKWVDKDKSARIGKVLGAQMIVTGAISNNEDTSTKRTDPYSLLLRMYDVETSRIVGTARASGKTVQDVIDRAVSQAVSTMDRVPWTGKVASISGAKLYLNAGTAENVQVGDKFKLFSLGKPIVDPDSKENIGYEEEPAGSAEVVAVTDRVATLKVVDKSRPIKIGDKVQPEQ